MLFVFQYLQRLLRLRRRVARGVVQHLAASHLPCKTRGGRCCFRFCICWPRRMLPFNLESILDHPPRAPPLFSSAHLDHVLAVAVDESARLIRQFRLAIVQVYLLT